MGAHGGPDTVAGGPIPPRVTATRRTLAERTGMSQTAIVVCVALVCIMLAVVVIALAGDPRGAGGMTMLALLLGTILGCVFHRRWS